MAYFERAYEGTPTWDIGRAQAAVERLADGGWIAGTILEVGCGTGENAILLAGRGYDVVGVDMVAAAIEKARVKAGRHRVAVEFLVWDALRLAELGRTFDTALDVGLFHSLPPEQREIYAASLRAAIRPGGRALLLCWSSRNPFGYGPERIRKADIRASFRRGWHVEDIAEETLETLMEAGTVHAWLARIRREAPAL
jgi:SAM-dependent methyltransferase